MKFFKKAIKKIDNRIKDIDHAILMYGYDAWGTSAFSNIQIIRKLEKEKEVLLKRKKIFKIFI